MTTSNAMPTCVEAERAVIGCLILDGQRIPEAREVLCDEDFSEASPRAVWNALCRLDDRRLPVDFLSVGNALKDSGEWQSAGGDEALVALAESVTSAARLLYYCKVVAETSTLRRTINLCRKVADEAHDVRPGLDQVQPFIEEFERDVLALSTRVYQAAKLQSVAEALPGVMTALTDTASASGLETGFCDVDERLRGMRAGELIVPAARPGLGKTTLAMQIALNNARQGKRVIFASLEMSRDSLIERMLCNLGEIGSAAMRDRRFTRASDRSLLDGAAVELGEIGSRIWIDDVGDSTLMRLRALARRCARTGLDLIVVDYLQLMREPGVKQRWEEVGQISRGLKALAKELRVPVVALAQLKREAANERPRLHHLRESGSIEQDADAVVLLSGGDDAGEIVELTCDLAKNRHGRTGECKLSFDRKFFRVGNAQLLGEVVYDERNGGGA